MNRPTTRPIVRLGAPGVDPTTLGGKGASLHRLAALGLRVPPGLCLTTAAFGAQRGALPASDDPATAMLAAPIVADVAGALGAELADLLADLGPGWDRPRFAVRSSAVGEDGSMASYAGLHDTELDVAAEDVAEAVRRCWASLWSPAAIAYRSQRALGDDDAAMAVVVQALVRADASAIAFMRHPVTNREDQIVITATRGLGDAMAAGTVTPDTIVVDRASRAVVESVVGDAEAGPALDAAAIDGLISLCLDVEGHLGRSLDIEAAIQDGTWFLLQARPITTGRPANRAADPDAGARGTAFPVAFDDPDDASLTWEWDDMHMPFALPPLAAEYAARTIVSGMNRACERLGDPRRLKGAAFNGYVYVSMRRNVDEDELEAADASWLAIKREQIGLIEAYWTDKALPDIRRYAAWMAGLDAEGVAPEAAVATWRAAWAETERLWGIHFVAIRGPYQVMEDLAEAFADAVGPGRDADALALIGGGRHELEAVDMALEGLAALAGQVRGLDDALDAA
ncbi:MAG TPA: PEP/pyruvate-binding domain-containing protein, partial [Candidatus Deferrimicrobiaceae bacterium]|nr:PEP/pyruvate-binding domain-containing protein [Candidatus Deferrimicrobiaceae bacterium]